MTLDPIAVLGLVGLLFLKEAGLPIPVPGDLLVLGAGVASAGSGPGAAAVLVAILVAGYAGGSLQFLLVRGALRRILLDVLRRVGVGRERLDSLAEWLAHRGTRGVAVARATPAVRVGVIAASGLAALRFGVFLPGLIVGNAFFVGGHFALGYVAGPPAERLLAGVGGLAAGAVVLVALAAVGAIGWRALRRRKRPSTVTGSGLASLADWTEAACPACLVIALARPVPLGPAAPGTLTDGPSGPR